MMFIVQCESVTQLLGEHTNNLMLMLCCFSSGTSLMCPCFSLPEWTRSYLLLHWIVQRNPWVASKRSNTFCGGKLFMSKQISGVAAAAINPIEILLFNPNCTTDDGHSPSRRRTACLAVYQRWWRSLSIDISISVRIGIISWLLSQPEYTQPNRPRNEPILGREHLHPWNVLHAGTGALSIMEDVHVDNCRIDMRIFITMGISCRIPRFCSVQCWYEYQDCNTYVVILPACDVV